MLIKKESEMFCELEQSGAFLFFTDLPYSYQYMTYLYNTPILH